MHIYILLAFCLITLFGYGQKQDITLEEVISIAQGEAPVSLIARTRMSNRYWRYQSFLADYKPQLTLTTETRLNRTIERLTIPDGTEIFVNRSLMTNVGGIELRQRVRQTGGFIFASSALERIDLFGGNSGKSFLSRPLTVGFFQPISQFNQDKWLYKLQGLEYESSRKEFAEERENIAYDAVNLFFNLYLAQLNLREAQQQKVYADSLYTISVGRFEVGRIAETDLLQLELRAKNEEAMVATELLNFQTANAELRNFLGIKEDIEFKLLDPTELPPYHIDPEKALAQAQINRSQTTAFRIRVMEAEMEMDRAIKSGGASVGLSGRFGLSQTAPEFADVYRDPTDQEFLSLTFSIPIADWGKNRADREIARSNLELTLRTVEQENVNFEREVVLRVQQLALKRDQLTLAQNAREVASERVTIAKNRYQIGKIDVTDLNIALNEYQVARRAYIQALWSLWTAHYEIRNLTLYDFISDQSLTAKGNELDPTSIK